jgi:hypothetical protein
MPEERGESAPNPEAKARRSPLQVISVSAVVAVLTNLLQFWHSTAETQNLEAERDKTAAEVKQLQTEQAESASRSMQSWLDELSKFPEPEDRVMVLSAAFSTSPDDNVKSWAKQQMERLTGEIDARQKEAEQRLAVASREAPSTPGTQPTALGAGAGASPSGAGAEHDAGAATPGTATSVSHDARLAAVQVAASDLARVKRAHELLSDAKLVQFKPGAASKPLAAEHP